jgi:hypothetical protein
MSTKKWVTTSVVTADSSRAVETFLAQYEKAKLTVEQAQTLDESAGFVDYLARGIHRFSTKLRYNYDEFFRTRPGLWVDPDFRHLVVVNAQECGAREVKPKHFDLPRVMTDAEIEAELGDNHLFDEVQVCETVATLIEKQEGGKEGKLLNNGYVNLFYLASCVVDVRWYAGNRGWNVDMWPRGVDGWSAGGRVFSPAN